MSQSSKLVGRITHSVYVLPVAICVLAIGLWIVGDGAIATWAEASAWHHMLQHLVIFSSGAMAGLSFVSAYKELKKP